VQVRLHPTAEATAFAPQAVPVETLWADAHVRIVNKPPGLVVHPAPGHWSGTLLNGLLHLDPTSAQVPRAGIVHRLDKDTSGLMVVARSRASMDTLVRAIAAREVSRIYVALVHGRWPLPVGQWRRVTAAIGREPTHRQRMAVVDLATQPGKDAATDFGLLASGSHEGVPVSWLCCRLHTGRTHQIRVHAAHLGHPLVSDAVYGGRPAAGMARQALHAARLWLAHPATGQALEHWAALPPDLRAALAACGIEAPEPLGYNLASFID
jgi:23S rRNA pseudouridine1911/1915/1917 synthase